MPDFVDDYDEESELIDKMSNRDSLASQKGQMSNIFQNSVGKRHRSLSFAYCLHAMMVTPEKVLSISGINMVKTIIMRHVELMAVCQSHSFEVFVSLANLMRFYSYIVGNVFIGRNKYQNLVQEDPETESTDPNQN